MDFCYRPLEQQEKVDSIFHRQHRAATVIDTGSYEGLQLSCHLLQNQHHETQSDTDPHMHLKEITL